MRLIVHDDEDEVTSPPKKNPFESFACENLENWAAPRFKANVRPPLKSGNDGIVKKRRIVDDDSDEEEVRRPASPQWLEKRDISHMSSKELESNRRQAQQQRKPTLIPKRKRSEYADVVSSSSESDDIVSRPALPIFDPIDHQLDDTPQKPMLHNSLTAQRSNLDRILQRGGNSSRDARLQRRKLLQQNIADDSDDNAPASSSHRSVSSSRSTPISVSSTPSIEVSDEYDSVDSDDDGSALIEKSQRILSTCESLSSNLMHTISTWAAATERAEPDLSEHCLALTSIAASSAITDVSHVCPTLTLQGYQLVGLNWLKLLDDHNVNGVLADAMGLGKTIQTIAFLSLLSSNSRRSPHLIIVPSSTLSNWKREIAAHCPRLKAVCYHGSQNERYDLRREIADGIEDDTLHVVLCTYSLFERESGHRDRKYLSSIPWDYIILDEAHCIKNANSSRYSNISNLHAKHRLLLSGTPVQNDVKELLSLLGFLMPRIFRASTIDTLLEYFGITNNIPASKQSMNNATIEELRRMLAPFVLRRRKEDVLLQLPVKETKLIEIPMLEEQDKIYNDLLRNQLKDVESPANIAAQQVKHIFTSLRKAANHPLLLRQYYSNPEELMRIAQVSLAMGYFGDQCDINRVYEEVCGYSDFDIHRICLEYEGMLGHLKLGEHVLYDSPKMRHLKEMLPNLINNGHRVLIFSQWTKMMDLLEVLLEDISMSYLRLDGSTPVSVRQELIDTFESDTSIPVFLLSTKAGGLGINLTAADTVILHDLDFNPVNDRQAEDRCHRIGQTRPVTVYKLIVKDTVDEDIYNMGERKEKLSKALLRDDKKDKDDEASQMSMILERALQRSIRKSAIVHDLVED